MAEYLELRIRLDPGGPEGKYRVAASGPAGEATGVFAPPVTTLEIENLVLWLNRRRSGARRVESSEVERVRRFGGSLFDALFEGRVRDLYIESRQIARSTGRGLRLALALFETPELMRIPWEFLYDDPEFLSISTWTPIVRYIDLPGTRSPLEVEPPLRILAMVSSPSDFAPVDVNRERATLEDSVAKLWAGGLVEIRWLEEASPQALLRALRADDYHVLHYIGHGGYDSASDDGVVALEGPTGRSRLLRGMELGTILDDQASLRLAVLNGCEGARSSLEDPFSGVATSLIRCHIPAVVAMQLELTNRATIAFAGEFYGALAEGYAVDAALAEARKAMFVGENSVEWATPALFMRAQDGHIFDVARAGDTPKHTKKVNAPEPAAEREPDEGRTRLGHQPTDDLLRVFISYSHKDRVWLDRLRPHLMPSLREGMLEIWDDTMIRPGSRWREDIEGALASAGVAVLLVSPDFLESEFIAKHELPPLLMAAEERGLQIFWIPVRYSRFDKTEIRNYQAAHSPEKPLATLRPAARDKALVEISKRIDDASTRAGKKE